MNAHIKVTPQFSVKPVALNINFYITDGIPVVAVMMDNKETGQYDTLRDIPLRALVNECLQSQDGIGELLKAAKDFKVMADRFETLATRLKKDGYTE